MTKKLLILIMTLSVIFAIASCNEEKEKRFLVRFCIASNQVEEQWVAEGEILAEPDAPTYDGFVFLYWADEDGNRYSFDKPVTSNLTLTAQWRQGTTPPIEKEKVTVRFFGPDGVQIGSDQLINKGEDAVAPVLRAEEFFVYEWDGDYTNVTSDIDIHAVKKYDAASSDLFTYARINGEFMITGVAKGKELPHMSNGFVKLALPETYNGLTITAVGDGAFENKSIYSLYIPSCYTSIGEAAFKGNADLSSVTLCEGLVEIGKEAFMASEVQSGSSSLYVSGLNQIDFPSTLKTIGDYAFYEVGRIMVGSNYTEQSVRADFSKCTNLSYIGDHAFEGVMLQSLILPETAPLHIGDYAFAADTHYNYVRSGSTEYPRSQLKAITLPSSVSYIGDCAFYGNGVMYSYSNGAFIKTQTSVNFDCPALNLEYIGKRAFMNSQLTGSIELSVSVIGDYAFYDNRFLGIELSGVSEIGDYAFARSSDDSVILELSEGLTSIGKYAFFHNSGLTGLKLPASLKTIGEGAFEECSSLKGKLVLPTSLETIGVRAFDLTGIEAVEIKGNPKLMQQCFGNCRHLSTVEGNIEFADQGVFYGCTQLKKVRLSDNVTHIPYRMFYGCESLESVDLPSSLLIIEGMAFSHCSSLEKITIPQHVTGIEQMAFELCTSLSQVNFAGEELISVGPYAFDMCPELTQIELPDSVQYISDFAFEGTGLTSFKTPAALTSMGYGVFNRYEFTFGADRSSVMLPAIEIFTVSADTGEISFDGKGTFYGSQVQGFEVESGNKTYSAYDGILYSADRKKLVMYIRNASLESVELIDGLQELNSGAFMNCQTLKRVILPQTLTVIGDYAFYNCPNLKSISIPASVKRIGSYAFAGSSEADSSLGEVRFEGNGIVEIGSYAFADNSALTAIKIPASLERINFGAFYNCSALKTLDLSEAVGLKQIGDSAFSGKTKELAPKIESLDLRECLQLYATGMYTFSMCASLSEINFGVLAEIDRGAFYECTGLKSVTIGPCLEIIYEYAFSHCSALTEFIVPENNMLSTIMGYAFAGKMGENMSIETLDLTNAHHLTAIHEGAFAYGNVKKVYLPDVPFSLSSEVFYMCTKLTEIDFGGVVEIGENVLSTCTEVKIVNIPASVTTISGGAFRDLNIEQVNIGSPVGGNNLQYIGRNAFFNCNKLKVVNIYGSNVPKLWGDEYNYSFFCLSGNVQSVIAGLSIVVDAGMKDAYLNSSFDAMGWNVYETIISERSLRFL